jgi:hypothetical protein
MNNVNIFTRFYRSITDFKFSNHFIKEKTSKAVGLLFFGYLLFILVFGGVTLAKIIPFMNEMKINITSEINKMPDFELHNAQFTFEDGRTYYEENFDGFTIIVDSEQAHDIMYYENTYDSYMVIKDGNLYMDSPVATPLNTANPINKDMIVTLLKAMIPAIYIGLGIGAVFGILVMFFISAAVWGLVLIINSLIKKGLTSSECYRVAAHAMVLPGIFMLLVWTLPFDIPMVFIMYLLIASFYAYQFMNSYEPENFELESIYEKE